MIQYVLYPKCMSNYFKESNHTNTTKLPIFSLYSLALIIPPNRTIFHSSFKTDFGKNEKWKILVKQRFTLI